MNKYFLVMAFLMLFAALSATVLLTDNFTGSVGTNLTDPANGWVAHSGAGTSPLKIGNTGLTYPGYSGSGIGTATSPSVNGEDINKGFTAVSSGSVYYSFMINTATSADISGYSTHFMQNSSYFYARFWTRRVGANINFGLAKTTAAATWDPTNYVNGTTYLIVLKYTFNTGSTTDDAVYMFVNPILGGAEPTPTVSITTDIATDASSISMVGLRQWNTATLATFDGVLVGTTWADIAGGTLSAPTTQASDIAFANIAQTQMDVSWTNGDGANRVVIMNSSNSFTAPADGTDPTADATWTDSGEQVIYNGSSNTVTVTGLTAGTTYWFRAYEYNGAGTGTLYLTTTATGNPNSQITATGVILPTVTTTAISAITVNSATSGGEVTADGGGTITARGACWNITGTPTIDDDFTEDGTGTGVFTSSLTGLAAGQQYYVRAYATNSAGTAYGDQVIFTTLKAEPTDHVSNFASGTTTGSSVPLTWADAAKVTPDGYLIKGSDVGFSSITAPTDGVSETNGLLIRNVTQGTQAYTFSNLNPATTYYFKIYPYTNSGTGIDYKTDGPVPQASGITQTVTVLAPGDLAIIAFQVDTPDQFAFITFVPIDAGTEIKFTDNGWTDAGAFATNEGTVIWTAPASKFAAGQIVVITAGTPWTADKGTVAISGSPAFATAGDQLTAYQGSSTSPTLLYSLSTMPWVTTGTISSNTTYLPTGLVDGLTAFDFSTEFDDQYYSVNPITGTPAQILASVADETNWVQSNTLLTLPTWEVGTLPVELSSFTAMLTSQNMVSIQWVTQSESNLNGYYIYRGADSELNDAQIVSPLISATNTSQQQVYQFTDDELSESGTYYYWLQVQEMDGTMSFHGPTSIAYDNNGGNPGTPNIPTVTELKSIFPNPFNPSATIQYALAKDASVNITIYNARGQIVRSFSEGNKTIGTHSVIWNGTDNYGRECGTGIYYFRMQAGSQSYMHKAVLMK